MHFCQEAGCRRLGLEAGGHRFIEIFPSALKLITTYLGALISGWIQGCIAIIDFVRGVTVCLIG